VRTRIPKDIAARLSARNLDDIPPAMRVGSPRDASDRDVRRSVGRSGMLPSNTNFGVVYRVCFAPLLDEGESAVAIRFGTVASQLRDAGSEVTFNAAEVDPGWILVTTAAIRWHWVTDRVPGMQPPTPIEELFPGQREAEITPITTIKVGDVQPGAYGVPSRPVVVKNPAPNKREWRHIFLIPDDASTDDLIDAIETRRGAPPA
jgi:hypothetical protein